MTFSNRGNYGGGRDQSFGRSTERRELFDAVCARCGSACKVPFRPNGRKEVLCSRCFDQSGGDNREPNRFTGSRDASRYERKGFGNSNYAEKQMFSAICDQCGANCQVPFQPRNGNPVLCSNCFANKDTRPSRQFEAKSVDLSEINAKLDKIIKLLSKAPKDNELTEKILDEIQSSTEKKLKKVSKKKD